MPLETAIADEPHSQDSGLWERDTLFGDLGGIRPQLAREGISVDLQDFNAVFGNVSGGVHQGTVYGGASTFGAHIDLDQALGWHSARAFVSVQWLRGRSPTQDLTGSLQRVSQIEIIPSGLRDIWLEQDLLQGHLSVRLGKEWISDEFLQSPYGAVMFNSTFGWPGLVDIDAPGHIPLRGLDQPMVRLAYRQSDQFRFLAAAFKGTTGAARSPLLIAEAQYSANKLTSYRFGALYQVGKFPDQVFDTWIHNGGFSIYAGMDRMVWHKPNTEDQGIALFARVTGSSNSFANLQINGGVNWKGAIPRRTGDTIAFGASYLRFSAEAQRQSALLAEQGEFRPLPAEEIVLEATYQAQVTGWLQIQPDLQYIIHPAGRLTSSDRVPANALVISSSISLSF